MCSTLIYVVALRSVTNACRASTLEFYSMGGLMFLSFKYLCHNSVRVESDIQALLHEFRAKQFLSIFF